LLSLLAMVVRISEPFVWSVIKEVLGLKKKKEQDFDNMLVYFVNTNMNLEYVAIILKGVQFCIMDAIDASQSERSFLVTNI
jgi:hypothetical protein